MVVVISGDGWVDPESELSTAAMEEKPRSREAERKPK